MIGKTTDQVATELGIEKSTLRSTLSRHPELRPADNSKYGWSYIWTDEKIKALREYYEKRKAKGGRPKGGKSVAN